MKGERKETEEYEEEKAKEIIRKEKLEKRKRTMYGKGKTDVKMEELRKK